VIADNKAMQIKGLIEGVDLSKNNIEVLVLIRQHRIRLWDAISR